MVVWISTTGIWPTAVRWLPLAKCCGRRWAGAAAALPEGLAAAAVAAWERDEVEALASPETQEQIALRSDASAVALIGPAIKQQADMTVDPVAVKLDANLVAHAIAAADTQNT
jgi:hypothetical protein